MFIARSPRVQLLSKCWYFAGASLYLLDVLHYFRILPPMTLATPQERVIFTILSTGAITGLAIVTVLVALLFLLNLTTNRPGVSKMSWTDILDSLPSQPIFFVCLIVNDAVYQRVPGTEALEGGSARIGVYEIHWNSSRWVCRFHDIFYHKGAGQGRGESVGEDMSRQ